MYIIRMIDCYISNIRWKLYLRKCKKLRNFTIDDLKPGVKIEWYKGISTIVDVSWNLSYELVSLPPYTGIDFIPKKIYSFKLDTNYYFNDEPDYIYDMNEILRIVED